MSDKELRELRDAYRYGLKREPVESPSDQELAKLVTGELSAPEREDVVARMLRSPEAIEKHKVLEALHAETRDRQVPRRRWHVAAAVAASALIAISMWLFVPEQGAEGIRSDLPSAGSPSGNVLLADSPAEFRWTAEPGAIRYRVEMFDNSGESLWESGWTQEVVIQAPSGDRLQLDGGARYFWIVHVEGASARQLLGPYWFRIE